MIETIKLTKDFGAIRAVDHLSFKVEKGEVLGFLGPNGAGKSTTMKMLTCFLTPTSGTAKVGGHDILEASMAVRKMIGYLPETAPAYGEMSVRGFLNFIAEVRGFGGSAKRKAVGDAIEACFLDSVQEQTVETLSKGYKRRVGLAQAILHNPPCLVMDEPTDGLDPNQKHEVRGLIHRMAKDKVIILSTHILEEVEAVCTRAVIIGDGRLVADGTPNDLKRRSRHHNAVSLTIRGTSPEAAQEALSRAPHVQNVDFRGAEGGVLRFVIYPVQGHTIAPGLTDLARERRWEIIEFHVEEGRLDEVFRELTMIRRPEPVISRDDDDDDEDEDDDEDDSEEIEIEDSDDDDDNDEAEEAEADEEETVAAEVSAPEPAPEPVKPEPVKVAPRQGGGRASGGGRPSQNRGGGSRPAPSGGGKAQPRNSKRGGK